MTARKGGGTASRPPLWHDGWYAPAQAIPSPNFGPRPPRARIDLIVLHSISLPPGAYGGESVLQFFTNTLDWSADPYFETIRGLEVSAHFFVRRDGAVIQFVSCNQRAWHAGTSCYRGRSNCNDDSVGIEMEGLEGATFESAQYLALSQLCQALAAQYPVAHIAGHEHIAPGRKEDPGSGFDWPRLQTDLAWPPERFPASTQPALRLTAASAPTAELE